jgi:hypothetical protein
MIVPTRTAWVIANQVHVEETNEVFGYLIRNKVGESTYLSVETTEQLVRQGIVENTGMRELSYLTVPSDYVEDLAVVGLDKLKLKVDNYHRSYNEIKNYMHNEEKITKKEILDVIASVVTSEMSKNPEYLQELIAAAIKEASIKTSGGTIYSFDRMVQQAITTEAAKRVLDSFDITVSKKE